MGRIHLLDETVASQVAAGEVVERPASVVKELVENSLDAKAKRVEVMIRGGGSSLVRVIDDGIGMDRDDALLCLERHATSKIRTGDDLARIATLGFRGEAVPSIASVSRFRLATRQPDALEGSEIIISGGRIQSVKACGEPPGTQIDVKSLFFNLPARRKFLRTENTEASHVESVLQLMAIGHPETGFVYVRDERTVFQLPPVVNLWDRIVNLAGKEMGESLVEVNYEGGGLRWFGFIGKPGVSRATRAQQVVFVNGRPIENIVISRALREGYHTALMKGQYPVTYLFLDMAPDAVDVNVHPAKKEVRFRDPGTVRETLVAAVQQALESTRGSWERTFLAPQPILPSIPRDDALDDAFPSRDAITPRPEMATADLEPVVETPPLIPVREQFALRKDWAAIPEAAPAVPGPPRTETIPETKPQIASEFQNQFRILGVIGRLYVIMENTNGLVLVDQHAAHERVLFEELRRRLEQGGVAGQRLLLPVTLQLSPRDADWVMEQMEVLQNMGIGLEPFGQNTFKLDSLPPFLDASDPVQLMREVIDELRTASASTSRLRLGEDMIATTVCRHAVKAHDHLREPELVKLIEDLMKCDLPYCCPHGRPTMIQISYSELEKKFGRKV